VRLWMLMAVVVFLFAGCAEANAPPEQPVNEDIAKAGKQPGKASTDQAGAGSHRGTTSQGQSPEECFATPQDAEAAGGIGLPKCDKRSARAGGVKGLRAVADLSGLDRFCRKIRSCRT
jgi:hypothetical protein